MEEMFLCFHGGINENIRTIYLTIFSFCTSPHFLLKLFMVENYSGARYLKKTHSIEAEFKFNGGCGAANKFELASQLACAPVNPLECDARFYHVSGYDPDCNIETIETHKFELNDSDSDFFLVFGIGSKAIMVYIP